MRLRHTIVGETPTPPEDGGKRAEGKVESEDLVR